MNFSSRLLAAIELPSPAHRRGGFTLIEVAVAMVLLAIVLGSASSVMLSSNRFTGETTRALVVNQTGWRMLDRLGEEIQGADSTTVTPIVMVNSNWITFQMVLGYAAGVPVLSDPITFSFQPVTGETVNGTDDNGDGRIDEGMIEYRSGNPAVTIQIAGNILGLRFNPIVNGIEYAVDVGVVDQDGNVVSKTFTEKVTFRN